MKCKDCKHWERAGIQHSYWPTGEYEEPSEAPHHKCLAIVHLPIGAEPPAGPFTTDVDQYGSTLWTPESFGCNRFEPVTAVPPVTPREAI